MSSRRGNGKLDDSLPKIDDAEFHRLLTLHLQRKDHSRRPPERVERPPADIKPSVVGGRIVNWKQYLEAVERGEAQYPPKSRF